jgi:putative ABC transport system ATP-binding protein
MSTTVPSPDAAPRTDGRPGPDPAVRVDALTMEFSSGSYVVRPLDGLTFDAGDGELVVLLGPSGSGKTTLLSCLAGLLTPTRGSIRFRDIEVTSLAGQALSDYRRHTVGVVFQAFNLIPSLSALGNVAAPMRLAGTGRAQAKARATELLEQVGLAERLAHRPGKMSGGQQQRVAIARALVHDPPLVIADEPTAHLDHIQVEGILRLIRDIAAAGRTVIVATHDDRVSQLADRVVELAPTQLASDEAVGRRRAAAGEIVFEQGDRGHLVYLVETGRVEIFRRRSDGGEELLAHIGPGNYFGELGPMLNLPRSASARAERDTELEALTIRDFRRRFPSQAVHPGADTAP